MNSGLISALIFLVLYPTSVKPLTQPLNDDVLGLIVFKADVQDPNVRLATWNEDDDSPCSWEGVGCSPRSNRVTEVVLDGFSLSGRIGRGLFQLQSLRKLSLARNNLTGTISPALARLPNLRFLDLGENDLSGPLPGDFFRQCGPLRGISLAGNRLSGPIPPSLGNCSSLVAVNFSSNQFSGPLPSAIWSLHALRSLDLSHNLLDGEVPQGIEGLYNMRSLDLSVNKLTGNIPDGIGGCPLLKSVDLSENSLSGNLPHSLSNLSYCSYLNLGGNTLTGKIWDWIGDMKSIETLDLSTNKLAGSVPSSIGSLRSLQVLNLYANSLSGSLPESMLNCSSLHTLDLGRNSLTGELPRWFSQLGLEEIRLSGNKLAGSLNAVLSSSEPVLLHSLRVLDVSNNGLFGEIPSSIGQLKELTVLDLSQNQLNGSIPEEIGIAISLNELILDDNSFVGSIPPSIKQCSSLSVLTLSHNELNGPLPSAISKLSNLRTVDLSFNKFSGSLPKQLSDLSHLISFNISHNNFQGELPSGGFFNAIPLSSVAANPSLCGSVTKRDCSTVLPKPIVLNPNSTSSYSETGPVPPTFAHKKIILSISALIAIGAAAFIVVGVIAVAVLNFQVRSSKSRSAAAAAYALSGAGSDDYSSNSPSTDASSGKLVMFSGEPDFSTGTHALLNKDCELGRGGFGAVYRTILGDGKPVAIKKLTVSSLVKSQDDFEREVKKLGKIRHPNLVELNGYYWTPSLQLLIYEYVSGGSLHKHLHEGSNVNSFLSWNDRFNIVLGMAKGLSHLHQLNVIHYNLKSSNILIGEEAGEAKVGDFGLARLLPMLDRYILSSKIQSALGYMAPEFACKTVKITEKCDVYGFGVLVLEVVTGKRPVEYMEDDVIVLCDMVRGALEEGRVEECIDARLQGKFPAEEAIPVVKLGLICTSQVPSNRPDMREVVKILELIRCPSSSEGQEEESN